MAYAKTEAPKGKVGEVKELKRYYLNGVVVGHVDAGKTHTVSAITQRMEQRYPQFGNKYVPRERIGNVEERQREITINVTHLPLYFEDREISLSDCPGHADYINNMISGSVRSDFMGVVVDGSKGVEPQTRVHASLGSDLGIRHAFVVINKMDLAEPDLIDIVESEVVELLESKGIKVGGVAKLSATRAIAGSEADRTELDKFIDYMAGFKVEDIGKDERFRLTIQNIYNPKGQGTIVTGKVQSGRCVKGQEVEIVGMGKDKVQGTILNFQTFNRNVEVGVRGMDLGLQIRGVSSDNVTTGMAVVEKGTARLVRSIKCVFKINAPSEVDRAGKSTVRTNRFGVNFEPQILVEGVPVTCRVKEIEGAEYVSPGDTATLRLELIKPVMLYEGDTVLMRESNVSVGQGRVVEVLG